MWDLLSGLADIVLSVASWRVYACAVAGLAIGLAVNSLFAESSGFFPVFFAIAGIVSARKTFEQCDWLRRRLGGLIQDSLGGPRR